MKEPRAHFVSEERRVGHTRRCINRHKHGRYQRDQSLHVRHPLYPSMEDLVAKVAQYELMYVCRPQDGIRYISVKVCTSLAS